jgi:hypothetical protein
VGLSAILKRSKIVTNLKRAMITFALTWLLPACAPQQTVTLMPRGANAGQHIIGSLDRMKNLMTVKLAGREFSGPVITRTEVSSPGFIGLPTRTTSTGQASALLVGEGGQVRCEFAWDAMMVMATGTCVDSQNQVYDLLIKN